MIEKLHLDEFELYNTDQKTRNLSLKINEVIDAIDGILDYAPLEMAMKAEPKPVDPYAEQRKWIGKLCWFSNGDGFDEVGYLTEIDPDMPEEKFRCNCHDYYKECKPVKPDDDIIYKGGDNE